MKLKNQNDSSLNAVDINAVAWSTARTLRMLIDTTATKRTRHSRRFGQVADRLLRRLGGEA